MLAVTGRGPGVVAMVEPTTQPARMVGNFTSPNVDLLKKTRFPSHITRPGTASKDGAYGASSFMWDD